MEELLNVKSRLLEEQFSLCTGVLTFNRNNYLFSAGVSQTGSLALGFHLESIRPVVLRADKGRRTLSSLLNC